MLTSIPMFLVPSRMAQGATVLTDRGLWADYLSDVSQLDLPNCQSHRDRYLTSPVIVGPDGPMFARSFWDGNISMFGSDLQLVSDYPNAAHLMTTYGNMAIDMYAAAEPDLTAPMLDVVSAQEPCTPAFVHQLAAADLDLTLADLNSKRRNEIRRAVSTHEGKRTAMNSEGVLPPNLIPDLYAHWSSQLEDGIDPFDNATYQSCLWLFMRRATQRGYGRVVNVYDADASWCFSAGFLLVNNCWHFNCYAQAASKRQSYSGLFTLARSFELLAQDPDRPAGLRYLLLTCPSFAVGFDDVYDAYKKHLSHTQVPAYGLCCVRMSEYDHKFQPPYFDLGISSWV